MITTKQMDSRQILQTVERSKEFGFAEVGFYRAHPMIRPKSALDGSIGLSRKACPNQFESTYKNNFKIHQITHRPNYVPYP
jgi:hypothetical protein